jgi:hypothetical protein
MFLRRHWEYKYSSMYVTFLGGRMDSDVVELHQSKSVAVSIRMFPLFCSTCRMETI